MRRIHIFLTDEQLDKLNKIAKRTGLRRSELLRRAVDAFVFTSQNLQDLHSKEKKEK